MNLLGVLVAITYLILGIIAIAKILGFDKKINNLIEKCDDIQKCERDIKYMELSLKEYNRLLSEFDYLNKEYTRLKADNEYLQAVCDDAKEQFEKMEKE